MKIIICAAVLLFFLTAPNAQARTLIDGMGRTVDVPDHVERVICSGAGCLRLLSYLQATDAVVAVDDMEGKRKRFEARPYALAHPEFKTLPIFGEFRGHDNPELILTLNPEPQVIFKTFASMGHDPVELQEKTGIPVVVLNYGNLTNRRRQLYDSIGLMGEVLGRRERTAEVIAFFENTIADITRRVDLSPDQKRIPVFLGGVASRGPRGFQSTEPRYPPFEFLRADNLAAENVPADRDVSSISIAKEQVVAWDPDLLFLDLSTLQVGEGSGGLHELKHDPAYQTLTAVRTNQVYGVFPYNWYTRNYGSILANAYFIGTLLYPDTFGDVDPAAKADEIYSFLVGKPVFGEMSRSFGDLAFRQITVD